MASRAQGARGPVDALLLAAETLLGPLFLMNRAPAPEGDVGDEALPA